MTQAGSCNVCINPVNLNISTFINLSISSGSRSILNPSHAPLYRVSSPPYEASS